jgi:hypothetical protein
MAGIPGGSTEHAEFELEAARRDAITRLRPFATGSDLTLDEYAELVSVAERATSRDELEAVRRRLPGVRPGAVSRPARWVVGALGGTRHSGRWRLGSRLYALAILGGVDLDLHRAQVEVPEPVITAIAILGGIALTVPAGVAVELSGLALLGGRRDEREPAPPLPGAPVIRVRTVAMLGGIAVKGRSAAT